MPESKPSAMQQIIEALERVERLQIVEAMDDVSAALSAARAMQEQQAGVPAGWKLVPTEPTEAMKEAAYALNGPFIDNSANAPTLRDYYSAMLAASPTAPAPAGAEAQQDAPAAAGGDQQPEGANQQ